MMFIMCFDSTRYLPTWVLKSMPLAKPAPIDIRYFCLFATVYILLLFSFRILVEAERMESSRKDSSRLQQSQEAKKRRHEELQRQKQEEQLRKIQEREQKRQQAALIKEQV